MDVKVGTFHLNNLFSRFDLEPDDDGGETRTVAGPDVGKGCSRSAGPRCRGPYLLGPIPREEQPHGGFDRVGAVPARSASLEELLKGGWAEGIHHKLEKASLAKILDQPIFCSCAGWGAVKWGGAVRGTGEISGS